MERIGFIGVGIMGKPMARNLMKAGYSLVVHNRSQEAVEELAREGAQAAASPVEVARSCECVITMLPDSPDVEQVVLGAGGVVHGMSSGGLFIDMSTIAPATARKVAAALAERGVEALDAPVSGGEVGAISGNLTIMAGGSEAAFARALPLLKAMGKTITHIGDAGAGQVCKCCNQICCVSNLQAVCEALAFAVKSGVDPKKVREALLGGFAGSKILEVHGQRILNREFTPGFKAKFMRKDVRIVCEAGRELGMPLFMASQAGVLLDALIGRGMGEADYNALYLLMETLSGMGKGT